MKTTPLQRWIRGFRAELFSPKDFVRSALILVLLFGAAHFAGWREYTSILSGTLPYSDTNWRLAFALGALYILLYHSVALLAPIFLLAGMLLAGWKRFRKTPAH